jgi:hypothetical protein
MAKAKGAAVNLNIQLLGLVLGGSQRSSTEGLLAWRAESVDDKSYVAILVAMMHFSSNQAHARVAQND